PDYVKEMARDIKRLETITVRFSKIGSMPKLDVFDLVEETRITFEYLKNRSSRLIEFELHTPDDTLLVEVNPQLYSWTLQIHVKNGIDAMKGKGKIVVSVERTPREACVRVTDEGMGLSKSDFKRIFDPGFTTKKRGWGLGLSLSKRIVEDYHKGKIRVVKSVPGQGTTM